MAQYLPLVLVPGLLCSARLYAPQIAALWPHGPVMVADHRRDAEMNGIAERILAEAPPRFALAGLSMGGYIAFAMMRIAPERIARLALLDTSARPDMPEQKAAREKFIAMAEAGKLADIVETLAPRFLHRNRSNDETLRRTIRDMAADTGVDAFVRQEKAIMSRPELAAIAWRDQMSDAGAGRGGRRIDATGTGQGNRRRHFRCQARRGAGLRSSVDHRAAGAGQCRACCLARAVNPLCRRAL